MHNQYMRKAIELAKKGTGHTNPNPLVGAVIVKNNKVIGEGYHHYYGGPHAEVDAFNNATEDVKGATMYVTLEPCSHYGKTPPCAKAIVEKGIAQVVIAMRDPNPLVAGNGIGILRESGIEVISEVLESEAKNLNEIFVKYITTEMPFCILKTAMTLDGKIATATGDSKWITNEESRQYVHEIRHQVSSIMVGIGTVLVDDPQLTTRLHNQEGSDPIRVIVDTEAKTPLWAQVLQLSSKVRTIIATTEKADPNKIKALEEKGAEVIIIPLKNNQVDLKCLIQQLGAKGIDSVLIEGGATLNDSALQEGIVDKVVSFIAPKIVGGAKAKTPVGGDGIKYMKDAIQLTDIQVRKFGQDIMIEGYLGKGE
ncbi:riboflavin biosynthesis protein RibD [Alkaliphilus metalliredigens QYMF]|uniref:Riboflavin biosynthesis protein RibD n=1 Tax=Alkaliphilus metalliredigens (strain QYMF) TaxID=293826 RepID=A6TM17_ALKMQ|nr:bifunctional diaminohydroxyphosphoribosylaminopyrimidine deaminase/5-amino-6-(5-phosphoribosylamino)uracil reductase RibD [Alkaliphilus metalliredigens]ABR47235.1 riboflavin biosynthesis protein RibD [Alkaliphilus metalliredigens QYMF]